MDYTCYTDGSCIKNRRGGWAFTVEHGRLSFNICGGLKNTTNQVMELMAMTNCLNFLKSRTNKNITVYTDSMYVVNGINSWIHTWIRNGWKTAKGDVLHKKMWKKCYGLLEQLRKSNNISIRWVKAHAGNPGNERVDKLARNAAHQA